MKKLITFMAVATVLIFLTSCKKDHADVPIEVKFAAEGLAYVQLPLNKYFIYKDSASGTLDSVIVTQSKVDRVFVPASKDNMYNLLNTPAMNTESFILLLSKFNGSSLENWFYGKATAFSMHDNAEADIILFETNGVTNTQTEVAFSYPFYNPSILSSLTIEGKIYSNAVIYSYDNHSLTTQTDYHKRTYYWARGIGIIKREIRTYNSVKTDLLIRHG